MRTSLALAFVALALTTPTAFAAGAKAKLFKNGLLSVAEPHPGEPANAHPFVNVIVLFGRLSDFSPADPETFKAKMGREDVTNLFQPTHDANGKQIGVHGTIAAERVKLGRRPRNVIRLSIQAVRRSGSKGPRVRDVDRVRFGAVEALNQRCAALADADTPVIIPGIPIDFTGSKGTSDPDRDQLTYAWDFGDGTTSTDPDPTHTYEAQPNDVTALLTASDGQDTCQVTVHLESVPPLPDGKTPGKLSISSTATLEFGATAIGGTTTRTLNLHNTDETDTSQVNLRLASTNVAFAIGEPGVVELGPGESRDVTITFAPQSSGHAHARLSLVANTASRKAVSLFAHGYGGTAPGNGPTFAGDPLFFTEIVPGLLGLGTYAYMPDGRRVFVDNTVHTCVVPGGGLGQLDFCLIDADCAANNGTCQTTSTCVNGSNAGQPCAMPADCPGGGFCPSYSLFDPVDLCSDGRSLFLISDEGTFTEPDPAAETERAVTVMRMDYDENGTVTQRDILDRTTTETGHIACDGFPAGQGGQVYVPEYHNVPDQGACFRSDREALVKIAKSNGTTQVVTPRIDAYEGLGDCDDIDTVNQLEMTRDGSHVVAGFESGGLWQIRPTPIFYSADITEQFQVHPDGSILYAATAESGATGLVNLYRITPEQVQTGPLPYASLVPCSSFAVPNNTYRDANGRTVLISIAATRAAAGSTDATALVSFLAISSASPSVPSLLEMITQNLIVRGTVAFSAPANTTTCQVEGLINAAVQELAF